MKLIFLLICLINICKTTSNKTEVITTTTGKVQGIIEPSSVAGKNVQKFVNIPYAEPPTGKLRFSKPVPKKQWDGILGNDTKNIACWQEAKPNMVLTEDCLILNIWTPYPPTANRSVIVWIHGGSYVIGRSGFYDGHNLVAIGDVIVVTINYRLSALGFLATGDERIKGNFGLFDQQLAMKWVKANIVKFGGNPQSITISGLSSGAACVSVHTLSNQSWPYFNRAVTHSGSMLMDWAITSKDVLKKGLGIFLSATNCTDNNKLLECLQANVTMKDFERMYRSKPFVFTDTWFGVNVDGDFLTDLPSKLLGNGMVKKSDVMFGLTQDETLYWFLPHLQTTRNISVYNKTFHGYVRQFVRNSSSQDVYDQALKLYQPKCISTFRQALKPILDLTTDVKFTCATIFEATLRSQIIPSNNVYLYLFSYSSPLPSRWYPSGTFGFAAHDRDVSCVFGVPINDPKFPPEDQILSVRMIIYITNFVKSGDPNVGITTLPIVINKVASLPNWPRYTNSSREYVEMESLSRMIIGKGLREKHCNFLRDPVGFTKNNKPSISDAVKHIAQVEIPLLILVLHMIFQFL